MEISARVAHTDPQDHLERPELQDNLEPQEVPVSRDQLETLVHLVQQDHLDFRALLVLPVLWDILVLWELLVTLVNKDQPALQVTLVRKVILDNKVSPDQLDQLVILDQSEFLAP